MVEWSSPLWKHRKQLRKHKKKKEKTQNKSIIWTVKKQWKHFFIVLKKMVFENAENTKKQHPLPQTSFLCFLFSRTENRSWK